MGNMKFNYTAYYESDEERIAAIREDILRDYPNLGELATTAAEMETPFGRSHEDYELFSHQENVINRLIDIVIVTEGKPEFHAEYDKACSDLIKYYYSWRAGFTYANPEEQEVHFIMEAFYAHHEDPNVPLITFKEARDIIIQKREEEDRKRQWEIDHTMQFGYTAYYDTEEERIEAIVADMKREYPNLGELAYEAAKMETPFGRVHEDYDQFSHEENVINRLINLVIVTEGKPEYQEEYERACNKLVEYYGYWQRGFTYANPDEQEVYYIMQAFYAHQENPSVQLITFKQAKDIKWQKREEEDRKRQWVIDHTMQFGYTAYYDTEEERIEAIVTDMKREYPNLRELAYEAAKMETPFGRVHEDYDQFSHQENVINRVINIIIVTEGKPEYQEEYERACNTLRDYYYSWTKAFTYANPEEQEVYLVMEAFNQHQVDPSIPLMTYKEAGIVQSQRRKEKEIKYKADIFRNEYPKLGPIADEVIRLEEEGQYWMRFVENDIIRLVLVIKLIEGKKEYEELYSEILTVLKEKYANWIKYETRYYMSSDQQLVAQMMDSLIAHLEDNNVPIVTFGELKKQENQSNTFGSY